MVRYTAEDLAAFVEASKNAPPIKRPRKRKLGGNTKVVVGAKSYSAEDVEQIVRARRDEERKDLPAYCL